MPAAQPADLRRRVGQSLPECFGCQKSFVRRGHWASLFCLAAGAHSEFLNGKTKGTETGTSTLFRCQSQASTLELRRVALP